ncbi:inositol monophosphatase [Maricaulis sp. W15]|uniref:histidinol-phosphatase n=1 Tax=Maricaulis sp. W15 TaxID=1772333 RepID=UPI000948B94D|nr:histidinol-phosphatase [Maricaulis sp. W15]OLF81321.1 inositol monophosphatase [Maricaulis sp. W15]
MSDRTFQPDIGIAHEMADAARAAIKPYFRTALAVDNKLSSGFDPVTAADRASEAAMRDVLARLAPDDGILGEEFGITDAPGDRRWVLDPIDGTRAFIAGLPTWTVLIALEQAGQPRVGVIDQPHIGERFTGWPGGASLDHGGASRALKVSNCDRLDTAIMATTDPYLFEDGERRAFEAVLDRARLCRFGFDAYAYAMLAAGGVDLVIESGLQIYDVQALIPVVTGAGGVVTNWSGGDASGGGQVVAAASRSLVEQALEHLSDAAV